MSQQSADPERRSSSSLAEDLSWYRKNRLELERKYHGQYVLIRGDEGVIFSSPSEDAVIQHGTKLYGRFFFTVGIGVGRSYRRTIGV